jgi:hypothetical protein
MAIIQPRVARNELPWVTGPLSFLNPERVGSIHTKRSSKFDSIPSQQPAELILKRNLPVVLHLSGNVIPCRFNLRKANREGPVVN